MIVLVALVSVMVLGLHTGFVIANFLLKRLGFAFVDEVAVFADDVLDEQQMGQTQAEGQEDAEDDEQAGDTYAQAHGKPCKRRTFSSGRALSRGPRHEASARITYACGEGKRRGYGNAFFSAHPSIQRGVIVDHFFHLGRRFVAAVVDGGPALERVPKNLLNRRERDVFQIVVVA